METRSLSPPPIPFSKTPYRPKNYPKSPPTFFNTKRSTARIASVDNVSVVADSAQVGVTWQIVVGAIAGVTPFVVAGVEFSKRIIAQRRCEVCNGSGLILIEDEYVKCPGCGGFLPWQSWKRFFSG
ncbi:hypothetical protein CFOL_v3_30269, partial [Cephalotus follicularis]